MNFEEKMKMRNGYLMETLAAKYDTPSKFMSIGFAAFVVYMEQAHQKSIAIEAYCNDAVFVAQVSKWIEKIKENGMKNILVA